MLKELYIKNMAVIGELRLAFDSGFHIFTGETGAGKSILVEAIGLILGQKVKTNLIRQGEDLALVEAIFDLSTSKDLQKLLRDMDLQNVDSQNELIIKRQIQEDGNNKVFINHQRATLQQLQTLSAELIDFTGQHDQLQLLKSRHDREILDAFLPKSKIKDEYQNIFQRAQTLHAAILEKEKRLLEKDERLQWIDFQLKELSHIPVQSQAELDKLYAVRDRAKHRDTIENFAGLIETCVSDSRNQVTQALQTFHKQAVLAQIFAGIDQSLTDIKTKLEDVSFEVGKALDKALPQDGFVNLNDLESQLFQIDKLKRKFGPDLKDVLSKADDLQNEKSELEALEVDLGHLQKKLAKELVELKARATELFTLRQTAAKKVSQKVGESLKSLHMEKAEFEIRVELKSDLTQFANYQEQGADSVSFWLSPNPGLGFKPLAQIASGGETSRLFLAIKNVLSESQACETFIFDEIDTGISGATVELTGKKLKSLAKNSQVFCVTHHAQIASLADQHFFVTKEVENGKTLTRVHVLSDDQRVQEIARLMGGLKITEKNLAFARELIKKA